MDASEIIPGLWQGASLTESLSILRPPSSVGVVVDLEGDIDRPLTTYQAELGFLYVWFPLADGSMLPDANKVRMVALLVAHAVGEGQHVLVHCSAGINRSGLIVARALMYLDPSQPASAILEIVRHRRPGALSNQEFVGWLEQEAHAA